MSPNVAECHKISPNDTKCFFYDYLSQHYNITTLQDFVGMGQYATIIEFQSTPNYYPWGT